MEMRKCVNGHYYDASVNTECPYCKSGTNTGKTVALGAVQGAGMNMSVDEDGDSKTLPMGYSAQPAASAQVFSQSDKNYIGRSEKMDICVRGDETISRENHAVVSYDSIDKIYYFSPGEGRNIVRHNGKAIFQTVELNIYDRVVVGKTELVFMPLCGNDFEWSREDADI